MLQGHILGGTLSLPDGHLYAAGDYLSSGANFHSQYTAVSTLGAVAAVECAIEQKAGRSLMVGDGDKLSYLLPQTTVRCDIRAQPDELTHVMQDGVRSLVYNADRTHLVDDFFYTYQLRTFKCPIVLMPIKIIKRDMPDAPFLVNPVFLDIPSGAFNFCSSISLW